MATGFALELTPDLSKSVSGADLINDDGKRGVGFGDIRKMMPGFRGSLSLILIVTFCTAIISLFSPLYVQKVVDESISKGNLDLLFVLSTIFAAIFFHEMVFGYLTGLASNSLKFRLGEKLGTSMFAKLIYLPMDYFKRRRTGDCLARLKSTEVVAGFLVDGVLAIITASIIIVLTMSVMFYFNPMLALLSMGVMALFGTAKFALRVVLSRLKSSR
nr:ABC transporter transmembrane domain-containing protein [Veronia nyctiphanis]